MVNDSGTGLKYVYLARRNDIDIIANILTEAKEDTLKTHIMYRCNLSYRQLEIYLSLLLEMELLERQSNEESSKQYFKITSKGSKFINAYKNLKALMS